MSVPEKNVFFPISPHRTLWDYLDMIVYRKRWFGSALFLGLLLAGIAFFVAPKRYRSSVVVIVQAENVPNELGLAPQQMTSPGLAPDAELDQAVIARLRTVPQEITATPRLEAVLGELPPYEGFAELPLPTRVGILRSNTSVELGVGDFFTINYTDMDPVRAQEIVTQIAESFVEDASGERARMAMGAAEFIEKRLEETSVLLQEKEEAIRALKQRYLTSMPDQLTDNMRKLEELRLQHQTALDNLEVAARRQEQLESQLAIQREMGSDTSQIVPDASAVGLVPPRQQELLTARAELAELEKRYAKAHPEVRSLEARIRSLEEALASEGDSETPAALDQEAGLSYQDVIVRALEARIAVGADEIEEFKLQEQQIADEIDSYNRRLAMSPSIEQDLQRLQRDYDSLSSYYTELQTKELQAETSGAVERQWKGDEFRIIEPARAADEPFFPNIYIFLAGGLIAGILIGGGLVFVTEWLDHSIKDIEETKALLPYPVLVSIPQVPGGRKS